MPGKDQDTITRLRRRARRYRKALRSICDAAQDTGALDMRLIAGAALRPDAQADEHLLDDEGDLQPNADQP